MKDNTHITKRSIASVALASSAIVATGCYMQSSDSPKLFGGDL